MDIKQLIRRKELLDLKSIDVSNKEWIYMLGEETRNSVAIEGFFASEKELEAVISRNTEEKNVKAEIINYFRTALFLYDFGLSYRDTDDTPHYLNIIKTLHSQLHKNLNVHYHIGKFRRNSVQITNARITPPFDASVWIEFFLKYIHFILDHYDIHQAIARIHTLFEAIHPFSDGNGRVGRLFMNFILITEGYVNICIKGLKKQDRERYYNALEKADTGIEKMFEAEEESFHSKIAIIEKGDFSMMEEIIYDGILEAMNRCIIMHMDAKNIMTVPQLASLLGITETAVKKRIRSGRLIASKMGTGKWKVYPQLERSKIPPKEI